MEEENVGKALEDSMNRLKRNTDIWDAICDVKEEEDVLVRKERIILSKTVDFMRGSNLKTASGTSS